MTEESRILPGVDALSPRQRLEGAGPWYRVSAVPAPVRGPSAEGDFVGILPAMLSAAQRDRPFVAAWLHRGRGGPLELITNAGPVDDGPHVGREGKQGRQEGQGQGLLFPAGARGVTTDGTWLAELDTMTWVPCPSRLSVPMPPEEATGGDPERIRQPTLFESTLVTLMGRRYGWLLVGESAESLDDELKGLRSSLDVMRRFDESSERSRFEVERAERRIAELDAYREGGLWDVRVLAGAGNSMQLRQIAPVLVGSVETRHHPYRLQAGTRPLALTDALSGRVEDAPGADGGMDTVNEASSPFRVTAGALTALAGLPRREVPGLRVLDTGYFDVTSEVGGPGDAPGIAGAAGTAKAVRLGAILDAADRPVGTFSVPLATLNRHAFVAGSTGAGKSQSVRHLLEQLAGQGIPWLVVEPAKSEYAGMAGRLDGRADVTVIRPSDPDTVPMSVNPLAPEPGYPVQAHIDMVRALFQAAFDAQEPFPQIMAQALQRVYEDNGWDLVTGGRRPGNAVAPAIPTLQQLQDTALQVISDVGYGRELMSDVRGFVDVRLRSLRVGAAGRFFEGGHPADIGDLFSRNIVLAIEDVANDEDKAFLIGTLLIRMVEYLRLRERTERSEGLRHLTVIEEAHRLLRDRSGERASSHAVELFASMLAETRAYGEGVLVAEQIPTKLIPDVIKNTALKVVHRLPAHDDRQVVGAAMNLDDEQSRQVVALPPGVAAVFTDGMDRPLRARIPLGEDRERAMAGPVPPVDGRRSHGCGAECQAVPCSLLEMRGADVAADRRDWAWLRIWVDVVILAHLTDRPVPSVPPGLAERWPDMPTRTRECLLGIVVQRGVDRRDWALRSAFAPEGLAEAASACARGALATRPGTVGVPPGPEWMIPQVRWLYEMDRLLPHGPERYDRGTLAPELTYDIAGVTATEGDSVGQRVQELRGCGASMEIEHNRLIAWQALLGRDDHAGFLSDLGQVAITVSPDEQAGPAAEVMRASEWLETVLAWPHRFVRLYEMGGTL